MARSVNEGFQEFLRRQTPTDAQRVAGASHRASVKAALEGRLNVLNFFETGSFSHGTGIRGLSDIDALVSLGNRPSSSYTALMQVKEALEKRFPRTPIKVRRPAVAIEFGGGYETWEVIPGFLTSRGGEDHMVYNIPGPNPGADYIDSAPRSHNAYVNDVNLKPSKGNAKSLARLIKAWKYYCNVPVSSFYLEMRAAQHVKGVDIYIHVWDLCLLLERLHNHSLAAMNDPSGATGRINACSSEAKRTVALSKLGTAAGRARKALEAHRDNKPDTAFYYLDLLFGGKFPAR